MANEFKVKKGLIVHGSGSTILDVRGSQGQLFSVTDNLSGSLFSVSDISGVPIFDVLSDATVEIGGNLTFSTGSRLILQSGSASAPALTFLSASATNNGIYREAYDTNKSQISIATEGTRRVRVNEAGIFSDVNVYASGDFRSFANPWHATQGTSGAGFRFENTADSNILLDIDSAGSASFLGPITVPGDPGLVVTGSGNSTIHIASSGTGLAGIYMDASNGDFIGSDYVFIGQDNSKNFRLEAFTSAGNITLRESGKDTLILNDGAATFSGSIIATGSITTNGVFTSNGGAITINNGGSIAGYFNGTGTSYTQGAIAIQSSNADTPEARGQGVFMYNQGKDSTWYMGTRYNNADEWQVGRASGSSRNEAAATATSASLRINNNGLVGIGKSPSTWRLDVDATSSYIASFDGANNTGVVINSNNTTAAQILGYSNSGGAYNDIDIRANSTAGSGVYISGSGEVGIGTTTPSRKLTVSADIGVGNGNKVFLWNDHNLNYIKYNEWKQSASAGTEIKNVAGTGNISIGAGNTSDLLIVSASGNVHLANNLILKNASSPKIELTDTSQTTTLQLYAQDSNTHVGNATAHDLVFDTNNTERMRIRNSTGAVGIGTNVPTSPLTVKSNSFSTQTSGIAIQASGSTDDIIRMGEKSTNGGRLHMFDGGVEKIAFYTDGTANHISTGSVGIGTNNPGAKFEVGGANAAIWINPADGAHAGLHFRQGGTFKGFVGYNDSADVVNLSMDGSIVQGINVNSSHNVGIGTTAISASLHVKSTASDTLLVEGSGSTIFDVLGSQGRLFSINDSLTGSLFTVSDISGVPILDVDSSDKVTMGTFGLHTLVVTGSKVLVGKSAIASTASLQVAGAISASGDLTIKGFTSVSASLAAAAGGNDNLGNHTATQALNMGGNNITSVGDVSLGDNKKIKFGAAPDFQMYHTSSTNVNHISSLLDRQLSLNANMILFTNQANNATAMTVSGSRVGIGISSATTTLDVRGNQLISGSGTQLLRVETSDSDLGDTLGEFKHKDGTNNPFLRISSTSTGMLLNTGFSTGIPGSFVLQSNGGSSYLAFNTNGSNERMRITSAGNVGIGTTVVSYKLHVNSTGQYGLYITGKPQASMFVQSTNKFGTSVTSSAGSAQPIEGSAGHIFQMSGSTSSVSPSINLGLAASGSFTRSNVNQVVIQGSLGFQTGKNSANILLNPFKDGRVGIAGYQNVEAKLHIVGGFTVQTGTDSTSVPATSPTGSENNRANIRLSHPSYSDSISDNGRYATEFIKVDRGGNLPVYVRQSGGTANVFSNIARFGHHTGDARKFAVFGGMIADQYYDRNNAAYFADFASQTRLNSIWFTDNSAGYNANSNKGRGQLRAFSSKPFGIGSQAAGTVVLSNETKPGGTFLLLGNTDHGNSSDLFVIARANSNVAAPALGSGTPQKILRLKGTGNLIVGKSSSNSSVSAQEYYAYSGTTYYLKPSNTSTSLNVAGDVIAFASSDIRMKEDIKPFENALEKLEQIKGIRFKWNDIHEDFKGKEDIGIIAQDVEKVIPEIVTTRETGYKAVDYKKLSVILIESVKELKKEVEELKRKINK